MICAIRLGVPAKITVWAREDDHFAKRLIEVDLDIGEPYQAYNQRGNFEPEGAWCTLAEVLLKRFPGNSFETNGAWALSHVRRSESVTFKLA